MFNIKQKYHINLKYRKYSVFRKELRNDFFSIPSANYDEVSINFNNLKKRLDELNRKKNTPETLDKQYHTSSKEIIIKTMAVYSNELINRGYVNTRGENSTLLLGNRGIGKSNTLLASCIALSTMHKNIIPIYLQYSCNKINKSPSEAIITNLHQRGIRTYNENTDMETISKILFENDLFAFIVVDELDQLYQNNNEKLSLNILDELSYIASSPSGVYCVIACGSSTILPLLITKGAVNIPSIVKKYPLVEKSPDLNGTKFPSLRLGVGLMTNEEINFVIKNLTNMDNITSEEVNFVRFFCGSNIRKIHQMIRSKKLVNNIQSYIKPYESQDSRADETLIELGEIIKRTYWKIEEKNKCLIGDIGYEWINLINRDWNKIEPICRLDLEKIIKECNKLNNGRKYDIYDYYKLIDTNWFIATENLSELYPQTPYQIIYHKLNEHGKNKELTDNIIKSLKDNSMPIIKKLFIE